MRYFAPKRIPPGGGNRKKTYKTNRKWGILLKSGFHLEAEIAKNLIKPIENWVFCPKERQAHGHPLASPRRGKRNGCRLAAMTWPGPGRPDRGKQNGFRENGNPFFPRSVT